MLDSLDWFPMYYPRGLAKNQYGALLDAKFIDMYEPLVQYLSERKNRVIGGNTYWIINCYSDKSLIGWRLFCKKHRNLMEK